MAFIIINFMPKLIINAEEKDFSENNASIDIQKSQIKNSIQIYFNSKFESIKKGSAVNLKNIVGNKKLLEYTQLTNNRYAIWYKELNDVIKNYRIFITYKSIKFNKNECTIKLLKSTIFSITKSNVVSREYDIEHIIKAKYINNKWLIDSDVCLDDIKENNAKNISSLKSNNSIDNIEINNTILEKNNDKMSKEINSLKKNEKNIKAEAIKYKELCNKRNKKSQEESNTQKISSNNAIRRWYVYDWRAAIAYAQKYAYIDNDDYPKFKDADCTNFVSQCIHAGGAPMQDEWYIKSYWGILKSYSHAWTCVPEFWNFIINNNDIGPIACDNTKYLEPQRGDPVQLWKTCDNEYTHTVMITYSDGQGLLGYSCHSRSRRDYLFDDIYALGEYDFDKERTAHIFGYYE